jgi:16S rRNA C1402 N4-methylase RsmH
MSFRFDAPLDMRMDTTQGETVADFLARASQSEIGEVIKNYGEERFAHAIAKAIVAARGEAILQTQDSLPRSWRKSCARANRASIRRRALSRRYGFMSTTSSKSLR